MLDQRKSRHYYPPVKDPYLDLRYLYKGRWLSYWYQLQEITSLKEVRSILEVGPGNKIVADTLQKMGYQVKIMDRDAKRKPNFVSDLRRTIKGAGEKFDLVLCCQVLEHLPYTDFSRAMRNLAKMSRKYIILSLPYTSLGTLRLTLPFLRANRSGVKLFTPFPREHKKGNHYWEIGKKRYGLRRILKDIKHHHLNIIKRYAVPENPYHYFIICEKKNGF